MVLELLAVAVLDPGLALGLVLLGVGLVGEMLLLLGLVGLHGVIAVMKMA